MSQSLHAVKDDNFFKKCSTEIVTRSKTSGEGNNGNGETSTIFPRASKPHPPSTQGQPTYPVRANPSLRSVSTMSIVNHALSDASNANNASGVVQIVKTVLSV